MNLKFTPTDAMKAYNGTCPDGSVAYCPHEGVYDVPDDKAEQLLSDFPLNFSRVGGDKAHSEPEKNRAEPKPGRNR